MAIVQPAMAQQWLEISTSDVGIVYKYDPASVQRTQDIIGVWVYADGRGADVDDGDPIAYRSFEELDCGRWRIRPREIIDLDEAGRELGHFSWTDAESTWVEAEAHSVADDKLKKLCS